MAKTICEIKQDKISCKEPDGNVIKDDSIDTFGIEIESDPNNNGVLIGTPDTTARYTCTTDGEIIECFKEGGGYVSGKRLEIFLPYVPLD